MTNRKLKKTINKLLLTFTLFFGLLIFLRPVTVPLMAYCQENACYQTAQSNDFCNKHHD